MKTKLLFSLLFLVSFLENAAAQEYHPYLDNSAWVINDWVSCCRPPIVKIIEPGTDAVIGDYTYKKFTDPFSGYNDPEIPLDTIYMREDLASKRVYRIVNNQPEQLVYDFSLENGDLITLEGMDFTATVDQITVSNGTRKRITLQSVQVFSSGQHMQQIWIEGVGSNAHPFYPDFFMGAIFSAGGGYRVYTQCSFQNGVHIFGDSEYCSGFTAQMGVAEKQFSEAGITFSPNPLVSTLTVDSDVALQKATLQFFNLQGKLVKEIQHLNGTKFTVNRGDLTRGMYLVQLSENGKILKSTKLMVD